MKQSKGVNLYKIAVTTKDKRIKMVGQLLFTSEQAKSAIEKLTRLDFISEAKKVIAVKNAIVYDDGTHPSTLFYKGEEVETTW